MMLKLSLSLHQWSPKFLVKLNQCVMCLHRNWYNCRTYREMRNKYDRVCTNIKGSNWFLNEESPIVELAAGTWIKTFTCTQ